MYYKSILPYLFPVLAVLAVFLAVPLASYAQDGISVKIQPSTIEERVDPGTSFDGVLTITNQDGGKQTYILGTRNVTGMNNNGTPTFSDTTDANDPVSAAGWIKPLKDSVILEQGQSEEVPYRITVPGNASPGSYFAAIFVSRPADVETETGAGVGFDVASLVNLRVNGEVKDDLLVREFSSDKSIYKKPIVTFLTRVENTGTVFQRPQGIITITDMLGHEVGSLTFNELAGGVMPKNDRTYETAWSYDKFALGKYTALASFVYGDENRQTVTREVSFWVVPIRELGIVFGGIVALVLLVVFGLRAYVRKEITKAGYAGSEKKQPAQVTFARRVSRVLIRLVILIAIGFAGILVFFS